MKKRTQSLYRKLVPVKLFLNDLDKIIDTLQEVPGEPQITIETADYELSTLNDLPALKQKIQRTSYQMHRAGLLGLVVR